MIFVSDNTADGFKDFMFNLANNLILPKARVVNLRFFVGKTGTHGNPFIGVYGYTLHLESLCERLVSKKKRNRGRLSATVMAFKANNKD
jgi:hypothetical protein